MGRLTLWGMQQSFPSILEGINLPDGMSREDFTNLLNMRIGSQYPYIQVPPVLEILIDTWFRTRQTDFQRMYDAMMAEYNPIENYDRTEARKLGTKLGGSDTDTNSLGSKLTVTRTGTESVTDSGTEVSKETGTEKTIRTGTEGNERSVSAYDAETFTPRERDTRTPDLSDVRTPDITMERTPDLTSVRTPDLKDVSENSGNDTRTTSYGKTEDVLEEIRAHGNIGVTTNQQMVESEMVLREKWNIYETIIRMFEREFMSRVY